MGIITKHGAHTRTETRFACGQQERSCMKNDTSVIVVFFLHGVEASITYLCSVFCLCGGGHQNRRQSSS